MGKILKIRNILKMKPYFSPFRITLLCIVTIYLLILNFIQSCYNLHKKYDLFRYY